MNTGEVLLADRLREKGTPIDAIYTHHPEGWGLTKLDSVMEVQADIWATVGVPIQAGEKFITERMDEVRRRLMPVNYDQAIDAARLLGVPFFSAHTPTDNLVVHYLNKYFAKRDPKLIEDVQKALLEIPEYRIAALKGAGPYLGKSKPGRAQRQDPRRHDRRHRGPQEDDREARRRRCGHDRPDAHGPGDCATRPTSTTSTSSSPGT